MSQTTYSYTFTDPNGYTDTIDVTVSKPTQNVTGSGSHGAVTGQGYVVTNISGTYEDQTITGMVGTGGSVQTFKPGKNGVTYTYDNTILSSAGSGVNGRGSPSAGNTDGLDFYGLEFKVGTTNYNLYTVGSTFTLGTGSGGNTSTLTLVSTTAPCFCAGTHISTPAGLRNVEDMKAGDLVLTPMGETKTVRWIGRRVVSTRFADPVRNLPVRIKAGAVGSCLPTRDLLVSPDHAMFLDGILVQAGAMVNGTSIVREGNMPAQFTYYHIETAGHELILAEGAPTETFVDNVDRMAFDNWNEYEALLNGAEPIEEMAYPRAKSARQIPPRLRAELNACATPYAKPEAA